MKITFIKVLTLALIGSLLSLGGCFLFPDDKKESLPPATQTGANTLGFLLNGQVWLPRGIIGGPSPNFTKTYDPNFNGKPELVIVCYRVNSGSDVQYFGLYVYGISQTGIYDASIDSVSSVSFTNNSCNYFYHDTTVFRKGSITITKLSLPIISGTFNAKLYKKGCDTVKITAGRFDIDLTK